MRKWYQLAAFRAVFRWLLAMAAIGGRLLQEGSHSLARPGLACLASFQKVPGLFKAAKAPRIGGLKLKLWKEDIDWMGQERGNWEIGFFRRRR